MFRDRVGEGDGGFWYESRDFSQSEHRWVGFRGGRVHIFLFSGTHLDAPAHFSKGKWRVGIFLS